MDEFDRPKTLRLSLADQEVVSRWGSKAIDFAAITETVRNALMGYVDSLDGFKSMRPEISYLLKLGLSDSDREVLRKSDVIKSTKLKSRSPADEKISKHRERILAYTIVICQACERTIPKLS